MHSSRDYFRLHAKPSGVPMATDFSMLQDPHDGEISVERRYLKNLKLQKFILDSLSYLTIVSGTSPNSRYSYPSHRFRAVCKNAVTIPQRKLEQRLIAALTANLSDPRLEEERVNAVEEQIKLAVEREAAQARHAGAKRSDLTEERSKLKKQIGNLVSAIADFGMSPSLREPFSNNEIHAFVQRKAQELADILPGDPVLAKQELQKRISKLILTPKETSHGRGA